MNDICNFNAQLLRHTAKISKLAADEEYIERRVSELMAPGGDFYPFSTDMIAEAVSNVPDLSGFADAIQKRESLMAMEIMVNLLCEYAEDAARAYVERGL